MSEGKTRTMWSEAGSLWGVAFPTALTGLILYLRTMVSMMFLGQQGESPLAAGSLAMAFANISGYSVLSGLSLGMEPLCSQGFGAHRPKLLSQTLHRSILFLLISSIPISILWIQFSKVLLFLNQPLNVTLMAQKYLLFLLPELLTHSFLHPIKVYLRAQRVTLPVTLSSLAGTLLHVPLNLLLSKHGVAGVAAASAASSFAILAMLLVYVVLRSSAWAPPSRECFTGWAPLLRLAAPSCASVCLEWWWYEIMILLCGLLVDPTASVAAMGVLIQTTSFIYVFPSSLSFAVSTRVGNELGANRAHRARASAVLALFFAALMGFSALVFAAAMRRRWGRMFTADDGILKLTAAALPILGLCELGNCPQTVACGVLRGTARPNLAANVNLGAFYLIGMPVAVGLAFWLGVGFCGLWLGLLSAQVCCAGLMLYMVGTTDWEYQACRAQMLTAPDDSDGNKEPLITTV